MPASAKAIVPLTASQLLLASVLLRFHEAASAHPVLSLALTSGYEVAVFAIAFGHKVWLRLEDRAVEYVVARILGGIQAIAPGFRGRLRRALIAEHSIYNVRGLNLINAASLHIDQVFVPLRFSAPDNPDRLSPDLLDPGGSDEAYPIWAYLHQLQIRTELPKALAVIGAPGSGKTTLLQHITLIYAQGRQARFRMHYSVPMMLFLRDHASVIIANKPTLGDLAQDHYSNPSIYPRLNPPVGWFGRQLRDGRAIVLLDGLDEIADTEQRTAVSKWIDDQIRNHPKTLLIVTARPQGYREAPLNRVRVLEVQPFTADQVRTFIDNWYLANEVNAAGPSSATDDLRLRARHGAKDLLERLRLAPALAALTVNPLLLTMIAMVHRYRGALPRSRSELYGEISEVLLSRWRQAKGLRDELSSAQMSVVLRVLAARMMADRVRDVATRYVAETIDGPLKRVGFTNDAYAFLNLLQSASGLLLERETDRWSFAHLTFQEYFTASSWVAGLPPPEGWSSLVADAWWHETLRLYSALGDATSILNACLEDGNVPALALAADCVDEAREADPAVASAVLDRVIADLGSTLRPRRQLAAEVKLSRRLKTLQRIDDSREIDLILITWAEYQLFLDAIAPSGSVRQPDHLFGSDYDPATAQSPALGIRAQDGKAFCEWLSRRSGTSAAYRLPRRHELADFPSPSGQAAWFEEAGSFGVMPAVDEGPLRRYLEITSELPLTGVGDISEIWTLDIGRAALEIARAVDLDLDLNLSGALGFSVTVGRSIALDAAKSLSALVDRSLRADWSRDNRERARYVGGFLTRYLKRMLGLDRDQIAEAVRAGDWAGAVKTTASLAPPTDLATVDPRQQHISRAVSLLSAMLRAADPASEHPRTGQRIYIAKILELCHRGAEERSGLQLRRILRRLVSRVSPDEDLLVPFHRWLLMIAGVESGLVPADVGLRVVREYRT